MDKLSEEFLKEYIYTHTYGKYADYDVAELYKIYASLVVKSKEDLIASPRTFRDFVSANMVNIRVDSHIAGERLYTSLIKYTNMIDGKIRSAFRIANSEFADMVETFAPSKNASILDVGAGEIPATSIYLAEKFDSIVSMDNAFITPTQALENMNVDPRLMFFDKNTPVSEYDFVVGKYPCSAIIPIITQCAKEGKPYLIKLCGHDVPSKRPGKRDDWREGWRETLPDIDEYIQFYDEYAFNLGIPTDFVEKVIDEHECKIPPVQKQNYKPNFSTNISKWFDEVGVRERKKDEDETILGPFDYE